MWLAAIAGNHKELSVVDPVSKTEFHFEKAVVLDSSDTKFLKFTLELQNSYVYIYSMKSNDGEIFSWNRLNEFDAGNKYGTLIKREKINDFDGWIRYYETQKNGVKYINCVSIIRGKNMLYIYLSGLLILSNWQLLNLFTIQSLKILVKQTLESVKSLFLMKSYFG